MFVLARGKGRLVFRGYKGKNILVGLVSAKRRLTSQATARAAPRAAKQQRRHCQGSKKKKILQGSFGV